MNKSELHQQERDAEVRLTGDRPIEKEDLIGPMRNVSALCNLYRSVVCLHSLHTVERTLMMLPSHGLRLDSSS